MKDSLAGQISKERESFHKAEEARHKKSTEAIKQKGQTEREQIKATSKAQTEAHKERESHSDQEKERIKQSGQTERSEIAKTASDNRVAASERNEIRKNERADKDRDLKKDIQDDKNRNELWNQGHKLRQQGIQRERLASQRANRQQRDHFARLPGVLRPISGIFSSWSDLMTDFAIILTDVVVRAIGQMARETYTVTRNIEQLRLGLAAFEGSSIISERHMRDLRELAKLPQVEVEGVVRQFQGLRGAGLEGEFGKEVIRELSNLTAIAGKTAEDTNRMLYFTQAACWSW